MSPVVSNSSPLIALARIHRLDLIPAILQSVLIPPAVAREISPSIPVLPWWAVVQTPTRPPAAITSRRRLGDGEWEAIALAIEVTAGAVLIDDRPARRLAEAAGLTVLGTLASSCKPSGQAQSRAFARNSTSCAKCRSTSASGCAIKCCGWPVNTRPD